jgi:hypothetical protein
MKLTHSTRPFHGAVSLLAQQAGAAVRASALCGLLLGSTLCSAWDGAPVGTINAIEVTAGNNQGLRVYLNGVGIHCTGGATYAYLNETDSNYKTYVAALLLARGLNARVQLFTINQGAYCQIAYMTLLPS